MTPGKGSQMEDNAKVLSLISWERLPDRIDSTDLDGSMVWLSLKQLHMFINDKLSVLFF